jgi:hypothetical protein
MNGVVDELASWTKLSMSFQKELAYLHMIHRINSFVPLVVCILAVHLFQNVNNLWTTRMKS